MSGKGGRKRRVRGRREGEKGRGGEGEIEGGKEVEG